MDGPQGRLLPQCMPRPHVVIVPSHDMTEKLPYFPFHEAKEAFLHSSSWMIESFVFFCVHKILQQHYITQRHVHALVHTQQVYKKPNQEKTMNKNLVADNICTEVDEMCIQHLIKSK